MPRGPNITTSPPELGPGQERKTIPVLGSEDRDEALARVQGQPLAYPRAWPERIVGYPVRVGQRWCFTVRKS